MSDKSSQRKPCRLCLLKDINPAEYELKIKRILDLMEAKEKASDEEYERRLNTCKECHYLKDGFCGACGCYVELRCARRTSDCPYERW